MDILKGYRASCLDVNNIREYKRERNTVLHTDVGENEVRTVEAWNVPFATEVGPRWLVPIIIFGAYHRHNSQKVK